MGVAFIRGVQCWAAETRTNRKISNQARSASYYRAEDPLPIPKCANGAAVFEIYPDGAGERPGRAFEIEP
jgi:hypothetical protein